MRAPVPAGSAGRSIATARLVRDRPEVVHDLLTDVAAWRLWSPHIAWTEPSGGRVHAGWRGAVMARFSPVPVDMLVTWDAPGRGIAWQSEGLAHTLRYEQRIEADAAGSRVVFTARVDGPLGGLLTALAGPLSGFGQRRRLARLARLAELVERQGAAPA